MENMDIKASFPNEISEKMLFETLVISPVNVNIGISIFTEKKNGHHVLRIFQMRLSEDEVYEMIQELEAFAFPLRSDLDQFLEKLLEMSGLDMLVLLNTLQKSNRLFTLH
ncbi:hypothetical protein [Rossellomorea sp. BNER]|uniref:hypothetical protein n=1 Tax=Rossellomorea sp. BNER TaxID=2962031 RepID=UPI003AF23B2F|nr:hypothetical protein [Rossellomorea sp. BNER]